MLHKPMPGRVIVKIPDSEYGEVPTAKTVYHSVTWGEIVSVHPEDEQQYGYLRGLIGHWARFSDDIVLAGGYSVIKIERIDATTEKDAS